MTTPAPVFSGTEFDKYISSLGMGSPFQDRAKKVIGFAREICPLPIEDVFVCDFLDSENKKQFSHMYAFFTGGLLEVENWTTSSDVHIFKYFQPDCFMLGSNEFKWDAESPNAQLHVKGWWADFQIDLIATGENCARLRAVYSKYLAPLLSFKKSIGRSSEARSMTARRRQTR